jgi:hypothetical protein
MAGKQESRPLGLRIKGNCYEAFVIGGGDIPKNMLGLWTSEGAAQAALDQYESSKRACKRYANRKVRYNG